MRVGAAGDDGGVAVGFMPDIAIASRHRQYRGFAAMVDGHVEGDHGVATVHIAERVRVGAAGDDGGVAVGFVPYIAVAV